jgi:hypothetical protein
MSGDTGIQECRDYNSCLSMCNGDMACRQMCQLNASPEGLSRFEAILNCIDAQQCRGIDGSVDWTVSINNVLRSS